MKRNSVAVAVTLALSLAGCATSTVTGFKDPDYASRQFNHVILGAAVQPLEARVQLEAAICRELAPTRCVSSLTVWPPTRDLSAEDMERLAKESGADAVVMFGAESDQTATNYAGTIHSNPSTTANTTVNVYGNTAYATTTTQTNPGVSTPIYVTNRNALSTIEVIEISTGRVAYRGSMTTRGSGLLGSSDSAFMRAIAPKVAAELRGKGLIQ